LLAHLLSFMRRFAAYLNLDHIQLGDPAQGLSRDGRRSGRMQIVELATRMRPTCRFL